MRRRRLLLAPWLAAERQWLRCRRPSARRPACRPAGSFHAPRARSRVFTFTFACALAWLPPTRRNHSKKSDFRTRRPGFRPFTTAARAPDASQQQTCPQTTL